MILDTRAKARAQRRVPVEGSRRSELTLSEIERCVIELSAPNAADVLPDRVIAKSLGLRPSELRHLRSVATSKLRHPAFGA